MTKQTFTTGQILTASQLTSLQQTAMGGGSTTAKTASYTLVAADAGTVVQMNSASATTITVNQSLFAAGDEVNIQNVGAGVCTVTAGTATVSTAGSLALSQYEGGQLYFNTTSAALFFDIVQSSGMTNPMTTTGDIIYSSSGSTPARLGIGTTGQVVTVASGLPSWATPAASGAYTLLSTTTLSTSNQVISSIDQTYKHLLVTLQNATNATANGGLRIDCNSNASSAYYTRIGGDNATFSSGAVQAGQISMTSANLILRTSTLNQSTMMFYNYAEANLHPFYIIETYQNDTSNYTYGSAFGSIAFGTPAAISSIRFNNYGGAFSAGTVKIYGVN